MDSNPSELKPLQNDCDIDRISDLPDSILGQILSYLPIEDIIASSILSTRWKNLFPSYVPLNTLVIDDSYMLHRCKLKHSWSYSHNFVKFVYKLLDVTLRDVTCVERVVFNIENAYPYDESYIIVFWVYASLRLNVKYLRLMSLRLCNSKALFDCLHGCKTLVELELGRFELHLPRIFTMPNLKRLLLYKLMVFGERDSINVLMKGCPVLNDLRITKCDFVIEDPIYIHHPILKKLFIGWCISRLVIDTPNLEAFAYEGDFFPVCVLQNIVALHSVCIDFEYSNEETNENLLFFQACHLAKLVKACSSTTRLCLSGKSVMALYRSRDLLPTFQNLTCLALGRMGRRGWRILAQFLKSAPNLTTLTFEEGLDFKGAYAGFHSFLPSLPVCLELHVKKIEIWEFKWRSDEMKLIEYFLKNGRVLEELIVHCIPYENMSNFVKLCMLPRHSKACGVLLKDNNNRGKSRDNWFETRLE